MRLVKRSCSKQLGEPPVQRVWLDSKPSSRYGPYTISTACIVYRTCMTWIHKTMHTHTIDAIQRIRYVKKIKNHHFNHSISTCKLPCMMGVKPGAYSLSREREKRVDAKHDALPCTHDEFDWWRASEDTVGHKGRELWRGIPYLLLPVARTPM